MEAGKLRHRVTIIAPEQSVDPASNEDLVEHMEGTGSGETVWANVRPRSAREQLQAGQVEHVVTHVVTMRYRSGLTTGHILRLGASEWSETTRDLEITGIINVDERDVELQILAKERTKACGVR